MHHVVPRLTGTPGSIRTPAPNLGQHNREVLAELGIDDTAYAHLRETGVVVES
jgi:formyl-CoA transferase